MTERAFRFCGESSVIQAARSSTAYWVACCDVIVLALARGSLVRFDHDEHLVGLDHLIHLDPNLGHHA